MSDGDVEQELEQAEQDLEHAEEDLKQVQTKITRAKEQAIEKGEPEGVALKRAYDKARSEQKRLEDRLEKRIQQDPELRGLLRKVRKAEEEMESAKDDWRNEVYNPAKRTIEDRKEGREERFHQVLGEVATTLEDEGHIELAERLEGAFERMDVDGERTEEKGVPFRASTWDGMRLYDEIED